MQLKKIEIADHGTIPLYYYQNLASTNQTLHSLIEEGIKLPVAVIAQEQSAGKGQWGRVWESKPGGLYLSLGLLSNFKLENILHLSLISGWGVTEVLNRKGIPVRIKWPNDLLLFGRKLGGIKIETRSSSQEMIPEIIIGIGINWHNEVPDLGINLVEYPAIFSLEQLAKLTLEGLLLGYQRYSNEGIEAILPEYLNYLDSIGKTVKINSLSGRVVGVNSKGELRVVLSSPGAYSEIFCIPGMISLGYY
jgi:BirA family transcriptional regulator, biotin operon repressor / biotin---[acetyl-CoA-carboxylase] ligase